MKASALSLRHAAVCVPSPITSIERAAHQFVDVYEEVAA